MAVEIYKGRLFKNGHERRALGRFLQDLNERFGTSSELLYIVVTEVDINGAAIDLLLISSKAIVIAELKELTAATEANADNVQLKGKENGAWQYFVPGKIEPCTLGGKENEDKNPYKQITGMRYKLADWLAPKLSTITTKQWEKNDALDLLQGWAVLSPGFDGSHDQLQLPWDEIHRKHDWFRVIPLKELAWDLHCTTKNRTELTVRQMHALVEALRAEKVENLGEVLPDYIDPSAPVIPTTFFSRVPVSRVLVDRKDSRAMLEQFLETTEAALLCLGGPGGIGKSHLAAWLAAEAGKKGYKPLWIDCKEREVSAEAFLTALASRMDNRYQAALLFNENKKTIEKYDVAIDFLEKGNHLLILEDFHKIPPENRKALEDFFTYAINRSTLKFAITTRTRPDYLDRLELPPHGFIDLKLSGFPESFASEYITEISSTFSISQKVVSQIWERTAGNPYAIRLLLALGKGQLDEEQIRSLPIFDDVRAQQWSDSLLETLTGDLKLLAMRLSVISGSIPQALIERLAYLPADKIPALINGLLDQYVLAEKDKDVYQIHDYIREALYAKAPERDRKRAHSNAGSYFEDSASSSDDASSVEELLQAIFHFDQADCYDKVLTIASRVFDHLYKQGDSLRALNVASTSTQAAKVKKDLEKTIHWQIQQIRCQLKMKRDVSLGTLIQDAFKGIEQAALDKKRPDRESPKWKALEARIWLGKGEWALMSPDHPLAEECYAKSLSLAKESGDREVLLTALMKVAQHERYQAKYQDAKGHLSQVVNLLNETGDEGRLALCISQLGLIARATGELPEAKQLFEQAYERALAVGEILGAEIYRSLVGDIELKEGNYSKADKIFTERLERERKIGNPQGIRLTTGWLFDAKLGQMEIEAAEELLLEFEKLAHESKDEVSLASSLERKGRLYYVKGRIDEGIDLVQQAIDRFKSIGFLDYMRDAESAMRKMQLRDKKI